MALGQAPVPKLRPTPWRAFFIVNRPAEEALRFLAATDPAFRERWDEAGHSPDEATPHRVLADFAEHFSRAHHDYSPRQLKALGLWLSDAVATEGPLENAVATCFLEHSRQLRFNRVLAPYLSKAAKDKSHA